MTTFAKDVTCPACRAQKGIRIVVDDRNAEPSDASTMRAAAKWVVDKHGGWKCSACGFVLGLYTELLDELEQRFGSPPQER